MSYEKLYVEIFLVILLLVLLNRNIPILSNISNGISGKLLIIFMICVLSFRYGTTSGVLGAFVYLLLNNKYREGLNPQHVKAVNLTTKCSNDRDCGACKYTCTNGGCKASTLNGSKYIKEPFIGSRSSGFDREKSENEINKNSILNTLSASCP